MNDYSEFRVSFGPLRRPDRFMDNWGTNYVRVAENLYATDRQFLTSSGNHTAFYEITPDGGIGLHLCPCERNN